MVGKGKFVLESLADWQSRKEGSCLAVKAPPTASIWSSIRELSDMDQQLNTGTVNMLNHDMESDTSNTLLQNSKKASSSILQAGKKRKYDKHMKYGFLYIGDEDYPKPQGGV